MLTMDPWFGTATIVFTGNYLVGPQAKQVVSLLCTLRMSHPSPIFLAGPLDLAAAAYLGLLNNLELQVALLAEGSTWAQTHADVFTSYGVSTGSAADLVHAMPPEHGEFLSNLAVSIKHADMILTAMPATEFAPDASTSSFASDLLELPHPLPDESLIEAAEARQMPAMARGSGAAVEGGSQIRDTVVPQVKGVGIDGVASTAPPSIPRTLSPKTLYVDPSVQFPALRHNGAAVNGDGELAALFYPNGHVLVAPT